MRIVVKEKHLHLNFNWSYQFVLNVEILRYKNSPRHFKEMTMLNIGNNFMTL